MDNNEIINEIDSDGTTRRNVFKMAAGVAIGATAAGMIASRASAGFSTNNPPIATCDSPVLAPAGEHAVRLAQVLGDQVVYERADVAGFPPKVGGGQALGHTRRVQARHQALRGRLLIACCLWRRRGGGAVSLWQCGYRLLCTGAERRI